MSRKTVTSPIRSAISRAASGLTSSRVMRLGVNLGGLSSFGGFWPTVNVMQQAEKWVQFSGSGSWSQSFGTVAASVGTDQFRACITNGTAGLPTGTYTLLNPDGARIAVGQHGTPTAYLAWTNASSATFSYTGGAAFYVFVEGSLTNGAGPLAIIKPGKLTQWQSGDIWDAEFLSFIQGLHPQVLRFMDWTVASKTIEDTWTDRTPANAISWNNAAATGDFGSCVPWEHIIELSNRLGVSPWVCAPPRGYSGDYYTQMAALFAANLSAGLTLYLEYGNELWNTTVPWIYGYQWCHYQPFTKRTSTANPTPNTYTLAAHGLTANQVIRCAGTKENRAKYLTMDWRIEGGEQVYVGVVDANTFQLLDAPSGTVIDVPTGMVNLLFWDPAEAGKTADKNTYMAENMVALWDAFDAAMPGRVNRIVPSQSTNAAVTTTLLGKPGIAARASSIAIAPYFYGMWWGAAVDVASGQLMPRIWCNKAATYHIGLYAAGSTPSAADVISGSGTGYLSKITGSHTANTGSTYTNYAAFTGLTNGTGYVVAFVVDEAAATGQPCILVSATASASASTVEAQDTYANQALRNRLAQIDARINVQQHIAAGGTIPVIAYEGGMHLHESAPAAISAWREAYQESASFPPVLDAYLRDLASAGMTLFEFFSDAASNVFALADGYTDTADLRYQAWAAYGGSIRAGRVLTLSDVTATDVLTEPAYPYTVATLPSGYTYTIIEQPTVGSFDVSGNLLRITASGGINWSVPAARSITLLAAGADSQDVLTVAFSTGDAWYPSDAGFAWSPVTDTDTAAANPVVGGALALTGTAAAAASGLWDFNAAGRYTSTSGMTNNVLDFAKPSLFAVVLDKDNHTANFKGVVTFGNGNTVTFNVGSGTLDGVIFCGASITTNLCALAAMPSGAHVYWLFYDPSSSNKITTGIDQTNANTNTTAVSGGTTGLQTRMAIGGISTNDSSMKHGSVLGVSRTGMTLAQAKAMVAKLQTLHGIA